MRGIILFAFILAINSWRVRYVRAGHLDNEQDNNTLAASRTGVVEQESAVEESPAARSVEVEESSSAGTIEVEQSAETAEEESLAIMEVEGSSSQRTGEEVEGSTSSSSCTSSLLLDSDVNDDGWLDQNEYIQIILGVAPAECDIISIYYDSGNTELRDQLRTLWTEVACLCSQFTEEEVTNYDPFCCNTIFPPQVAIPNSFYPEPDYTNVICESITAGVQEVCNQSYSNNHQPLVSLFGDSMNDEDEQEESLENEMDQQEQDRQTEGGGGGGQSSQEQSTTTTATTSSTTDGFDTSIWTDPKTIGSLVAFVVVMLIIALLCVIDSKRKKQRGEGEQIMDDDMNEKPEESAIGGSHTMYNGVESSEEFARSQAKATKMGMIVIPKGGVVDHHLQRHHNPPPPPPHHDDVRVKATTLYSNSRF